MRWATWLLLLVVGCQPDPEFVTVENLTVGVQIQSKTDRNWQKVSLRRLYEVPREPDVVLYNPGGPIVSGPDGSFYCRDAGDLKIKRFDEDGNFVQAYGGFGEVHIPAMWATRSVLKWATESDPSGPPNPAHVGH